MGTFIRYEYTVYWDLSKEPDKVADLVKNLIGPPLDIGFAVAIPIPPALDEIPMMQKFLLRGARSLWGWSTNVGNEEGLSLSRHKHDDHPAAFALVYIKGYPSHLRQ